MAIKGGRIPPPGSMPSLEEIEEILGYDTYREEEKRYATSSSSDRGEKHEGLQLYDLWETIESIITVFFYHV